MESQAGHDHAICDHVPNAMTLEPGAPSPLPSWREAVIAFNNTSMSKKCE